MAILAAVLPVQRTSAQQPPVPAIAPSYRAPATQPSPAGIVGVTEQPFVGISLQDAVGMALLSNPNLAITAGNVRIARFNVVGAKGPFDLQLHLEPSSSFQVTPPLNVFFAGPGEIGKYTCKSEFGQFTCYQEGPGNIIQHQSSFDGTFQGQSVNGTLYSIGIIRTRTYNNTIVNFFNPSYQSSLNLSVDQPLLRNFGMNAEKRNLKVTMIDEDTTEAQALVGASDTIAQVEDAYWDLVAAWRTVAIDEDALKEAIAVQRSNVRLAARGAAPPVLAVEAQTQVARFQSNLYASLQYVSDLQNHLKSLIVTDPHDPIWNANLVPSSPVVELPSVGDLNAIVAEANQSRPEVRVAKNLRRQADLDHAYARNQMLPQADFTATYQSNGFAGVLGPVPKFETESCAAIPHCPTPPPESIGKMGQATGNMWAWRYPAFNVALIFNVPIQNDAARGLLHQADEERTQAEVSLQAVDQRILAEARNALQVYESSLSRIYSARTSRESAESVYASELRKYRAGESTTYLVLQRQLELAQARGRELQAQTDLNKAVVELQRVQGTILRANSVSLKTLGSRALATPSPTPSPMPSPGPTAKS
jgi:outer membrane protein TolC